MTDSWINHTVYGILERVGDFADFYSQTTEYLAAICFLMAMGMACLKIFLQAADARQEIIRLFLNFIVYTVMIWLYPIAMKAILPFAMNMGYGAVFGGGLYEATVDSNETGKSKAGFYEWIDENSGDVFTTTETTDSSGQAKVSLNFNIVDSASGYVDMNKSFSFIIAFARMFWVSIPAVTIFSGAAILMTIVLFMISLLIVVVVYIVVLINYLMALLDYFALQGFGILFVPMILWEGTKSNTANLISSITKITVKLIVISAIMFLSFMTIVDAMEILYLKDGLLEYEGMFEMCLTLIFQGVFIYVMTKETGAISGFLMGGSPSLSFGEFARAAGRMGATVAGGVMAGKAATNAVNNVKNGVMRSIGSGAHSLMGGQGGLSALKSIGATAAGGAVGGLAAMAKSAPGALQKAAGTLADATGMTGAVSQEGIGMPGHRGGFGERGAPPEKGKSGSGGSGGSEKDNSSDGGSAGAGSTGSEKRTADPSNLSVGSSDGGGSGGKQSAAGGSAKALQDNWKKGLSGVYGNADGNSGSLSNRLIQSANVNAQSSSSYSRALGGLQGTAGIFGQNYAKARETMGTGHALGSALKSTFHSAPNALLASAMNANGGMTNAISSHDGKSPDALRGTTSKIQMNGAGAKMFDSAGNITEDRSKAAGINRYNRIQKLGRALENAVPPSQQESQAPKDSDAVDFAKESTLKVAEPENKQES